MARGGKRTGAGRKRGPNKATIARQERAAASGAMPLDVMLEAMRYFRGLAGKYGTQGNTPDEKQCVMFLRDAAAIAKDLAPYYHPRLASTTIQSNPDKPVVARLEVKFV